MRCINKKLSILLILCVISTGISGCNKNNIPLNYRDFSNYATDHIQNSKASGFASSLAIANEDIYGKSTLQLDNSSAAGLFSISDGEVIYAKDIHKKMYPASLTKIMTAYLALKYSNMQDVITCSPNVSKFKSDETTIGLKVGDQLTVSQAMHALLINSANDAAVAIAEHISGSVEEFCTLMNNEAKSLGATNTNFVNPNGLPNDNHYTTVYDLYLITNEVIKNPAFLDIAGKDEYVTSYNDNEGKPIELELKTTNLFLRGNYAAPDTITVLGGKTGTTYQAGNCLNLIVKDNYNNYYIGIILKVTERAMVNSNMAELLGEILNR